MGFFSKNDKFSKENNANTIISEGTTFIGAITSSGSLQIDGKFEGVILNCESLVIGKTGEVVGEVKVENIVVNGLLDGNIDCDSIYILDSGKVIGEIRYKDIQMDEKGVFEGRLIKKDVNLISSYSTVTKKINGVLDYIEQKRQLQ